MLTPVPMTITFPIEGTTVLWLANGRRICEMHWQAARELGRALQRPAICAPPAPFRFHVELDRIVITIAGKLIADPPRDAARQLGSVLIGVAGKAEEIDNATKIPVSFAEGAPSSIIADAALAVRSGAPFGLSDNPKILEEAKKEAFGNRDLRLALPTMKGHALLGAPKIRQYSPNPKDAAREVLAAMSPEEREALARQALSIN